MSVDELRNLIENKILYDIIQYCELNDKSPIDVVNKVLKDNLIIMKYGDKPPMFNDKPEFVQLEEVKSVSHEEELFSSEEKPILVDTPLQIPDTLPVFEEEIQPKKKRRKLNVK